MLGTIVGRPVAELDTPALLVDVDALDRNIAGIAHSSPIASGVTSWKAVACKASGVVYSDCWACVPDRRFAYTAVLLEMFDEHSSQFCSRRIVR